MKAQKKERRMGTVYTIILRTAQNTNVSSVHDDIHPPKSAEENAYQLDANEARHVAAAADSLKWWEEVNDSACEEDFGIKDLFERLEEELRCRKQKEDEEQERLKKKQWRKERKVLARNLTRDNFF